MRPSSPIGTSSGEAEAYELALELELEAMDDQALVLDLEWVATAEGTLPGTGEAGEADDALMDWEQPSVEELRLELAEPGSEAELNAAATLRRGADRRGEEGKAATWVLPLGGEIGTLRELGLEAGPFLHDLEEAFREAQIEAEALAWLRDLQAAVEGGAPAAEPGPARSFAS